MRFKVSLLLVLALLSVALMPTVASALVNEYGMTFAGEPNCLRCHDAAYAQTVHGRFAKQGLVPAAPAGWTQFQAAGDVAASGTANPGSGAQWFKAGGVYPINLTWITLGDWVGGAATEYIFFNGNTTGNNKNPWNIAEGLVAEPGVGYEVGAEAPTVGLYDEVYGCQRCHMLGTTTATKNSTDTAAVPNPNVSVAATYTTPSQWARALGTTKADFATSPTVGYAGMSIQCEACHGTGFSATSTNRHFDTGTQLSNRIASGTVGNSGQVMVATNVNTLLDSQVCGQCHGSYTNVSGTLGIYGYTPNLKLRNFVNINGTPPISKTGQVYASYTYTPTEAEFLLNPLKYYLFPNGDNAAGGHFYYDEWSTSAHSYRGALTSASPDALKYQKTIGGHFNAKTSNPLTCGACHTGEGYLYSKGSMIASWAAGINREPFIPTSQNTGYSGQECVICHDAHPAGVGVASNIRTPDRAGVRSNTGRATANTSVCEDCHNWQQEVQGTTIAPTTTGRGPSHPQREVFNGRSVMYEVADTGKFMPGVKCEQCHMPKTNKGANRYAHGMKIMLPAKAELWNNAAIAKGGKYYGEDSCSICHKESRTALQAYIDGWQAEASAEASAANAAIAAAKLRTEFGLASGKELAGRAFINYKAYDNDGSRGAHNPPYEMAGLKAATRMARSVGGTFDQFYVSSRRNIGGIGVVSAHADNGDGSSAAGAVIGLEKLVAGVWTQVDSSVTDANGNVGFIVAANALGNFSYRVRWDRCSNNIADLYSGTGVMSVVKIPSTTSINLPPYYIYYGASIKLTGRVSPAAPGGYVTIQAKKGTGSWVNLTTATLSPTSTYVKYVKPSARATWYYRVYYRGTATVAASYSTTRRVIVR